MTLSLCRGGGAGARCWGRAGGGGGSGPRVPPAPAPLPDHWPAPLSREHPHTVGQLLTAGRHHPAGRHAAQVALNIICRQVALALRRLGGAAGWKDLVMAGDFNSRPSHAAYYLLLNGCLSVAHQRDLAAAATACQVLQTAPLFSLREDGQKKQPNIFMSAR